eukprot:5290725-Pleurochrysis_carterae.AAC.2
MRSLSLECPLKKRAVSCAHPQMVREERPAPASTVASTSDPRAWSVIARHHETSRCRSEGAQWSRSALMATSLTAGTLLRLRLSSEFLDARASASMATSETCTQRRSERVRRLGRHSAMASTETSVISSTP